MRRFKALPNLDYLNECFLLGDDGVFVWKIRPLSHFSSTSSWKLFNKRFSGKIAGNLDTRGHLGLWISGQSYMAHRIAFYMYNGSIDALLEVDHINESKTDNSRKNLRQASHSQNRCNTRFYGNSSGLKGVYWNEKTKSWRASCRKNGKLHYIGLFKNKIDAYEAVNKKRNSLHAEFANHGHGSVLLTKDKA